MPVRIRKPDVRRPISKPSGLSINTAAQPSCSPTPTELDVLNSELGCLLEHAGNGIRIIDTNFTVLNISREFEKISGYTAAQAVGRKCWEVFPGPFCHTAECRLERIMGGETTITAELNRSTAEDTTIPCIITAIALRTDSGALIGMVEVLKDVTERKEWITQLQESEERYRTLIDLDTKAGEAIVMLQDFNGKEGIQTFVNDNWPLITGFTREELLNSCFYDLVVPEDRGPAAKRHHTRMEGYSVPGLFQLGIVRKNGTQAMVEITGACTHHLGKIVDVLYIRDVSSRKGVNSKLSYYRTRLEEMVNNRTLELTREIERRRLVEEQLQQLYDRVKRLYEKETKMRSSLEAQIKDRVYFTRAIVHELKTPLTAVIASSEPLITGDNEYRTRLALNINKAAHFLNNRIDELLDLARGEIGMLKLNPGDISPSVLVNEVSEQISAEARSNGQNIIIDLPEFLPHFRGDFERLQQTLLNLIKNALKFNPKPGRICLSVRSTDTNIVFEVKDQGPGIPLEEQTVIFQPYRKLNIASENMGGLGLGLALVKLFVELHGGKVYIQSQQGQGSIFGFSIPLERETRGQSTYV
jgi:PAS domain S-box-containing protein